MRLMEPGDRGGWECELWGWMVGGWAAGVCASWTAPGPLWGYLPGLAMRVGPLSMAHLLRGAAGPVT